MKDDKDNSRPERVLVIDDSRQIRDFLADYILTPHGFEVVMAEDGIEGLRLAFDTHPDLMIVDVQMPGMGGLELLRRVQLRRLNVPTILITAHGSEQVAVDALRLGVRDYVVKPFDVRQMEEAIERALYESRLEDAHGELERRVEQQERNLQRLAQQVNALFSFSRFLAKTEEMDRDAARGRNGGLSVPARISARCSSGIASAGSSSCVLRTTHARSRRQCRCNRAPPPTSCARGRRRSSTRVRRAKRCRPVRRCRTWPMCRWWRAPKRLGVLSVASRVSGRAMSQRDRRLLAILAKHGAVSDRR
jgi:DNA-binding response OmpR family regulator